MTELRDFRPVFVVGAPRSGTTLVYSLLLASGQFPLYEEGETRLLECRSRYGPLRLDSCYRRFIDAWLASAQFRRSGLPPEPFRREAAHCRDSYLDFLRFFMAEMCRFHGKDRWAEKTPANVHHMERLSREFPSARFVHVIRDARDVALSRRKLGWNLVASENPAHQLLGAVKHWEQLVRIGRGSGVSLGDRYMELRYEDLLQRPEHEIERLAAFTDAPIPSRIEGDNRVGALDGGFSAFETPVEGISAAPLERWRDQLTERERRLVALCVGRILDELGYPVEHDGIPRGLRWRIGLRAAAYDNMLTLRRWLRNHTPVWALRSPRLLDYEDVRPPPRRGLRST